MFLNRKFFCIFLIILLLLTPMSCYARGGHAPPPTRLTHINSNVTLSDNSSLIVSQDAEYYIRETDEVVYFFIPVRGNQNISDLSVVTPGLDSSYTVSRDGERYVVNVTFPENWYDTAGHDKNQVVHLDYRVNNAVVMYDDVSVLQYVLFDSYYSEGYGASAVFNFPGSGDVNFWTAKSYVVDDAYWVNDSSYVIESNSITGSLDEDILMPNEMFSQKSGMIHADGKMHDYIVSDHERIDKRNHEYQNFMILLLEVFLLLLVLPLVSYAVIKIIRSKQNYGIMSSLPDDSGILKVNSLNYGNVGCVDSCGFLAVLVNLINRGYLVIDNSENPYNTNLTLSRKDRSDLKRYELMVLEYTGLVNLFDSSFGYKVKKDKKELLDSLDQMEGIDLGLKALEDHYFDFYLSRRDDFGRFMREFSKATVDEESISADGYFDDTLFKIHKIISYFVLSVVLIVAVITLLGVLFYGIQFIGLILVLLLLYVPVFLLSRPSSLYCRWTEKGSSYHNEWMEFREYLTDEDAIRANPPEDIDEWLKYMEYAAALGVLPRFSKITRDYFNMSIRPANEFSEYYMFTLIYHMMCRYYLFYGRYDGRYITQSMIGGTLKKYRDENPLIWSKIKEYVY